MKRALPLLLLVAASVAIAACAQTTAPRGDEPCSGVLTGTGKCDTTQQSPVHHP